MPGSAELIEASLLILAERGIELRHGLYERFFAAYPVRRADFLCPETTSIRMTDETLQMLHGLAGGEPWVWPLIAELVATHRSYGHLPLEEYEAFVDLVVDEVRLALGAEWTGAIERAWLAQAVALKALIARASSEWERILPRTLAAAEVG